MMYEKNLEWLEEIGVDSEILRLSKLRHEKRVALIHINYEIDRIHRWWSCLDSEKTKTLAEYHSIDLQMAEIDGRLLLISDIPKAMKKESTIEKLVSKLSVDERAELIKELKNF